MHVFSSVDIIFAVASKRIDIQMHIV